MCAVGGGGAVTIIRVVDFETSGTEPPSQVCEVGICDVDLERRAISVPMTWLCRVNAMPPEVRAVHHISFTECEAWDAFDADVMFRKPCDAIAAHNSEFETKFFTSPEPVICTYKAALRVWPNAPSHSNGALRYWLEDQGKIAPTHAMTQPAHRAGPDAYVTAHILLALFDAGATGREMVAWTKEPRLLPTCPLGKFRGVAWPEVESGFLDWMMKQPTMEADLKWNAKRELTRRAEART
jgi:exodeoxyribonuclease X